MGKKDVDVKAPEAQVIGLKVVIASVCMAASLLFDIFAMSHESEQIWMIAVASLVFIISVYFFVNSILLLRYSYQVKQEELYDDLFKSSKATYLMMKKYFDEIQEQLDEFEDKMGLPQEEIIDAQKSIAKITISRNKENTDALMNSNDKVIEKIFDFEDQLSKIEERIQALKSERPDDHVQDVLLKQQELSNLVKEIEVSLKKEILSINTKIQSQPAAPTVMMAPPVMQAAPAYVAQEPTVAEPIAEESELELFPTLDSLEELSLEEEPLLETESVIEEEPVVETEPVMEEEPVVETEPVMEEEPVVETEPVMEEEPVVETEPVMEEEPVVETEPVIEEEPVEEAEPVIEEPVVEEEKPPMPDLSDPNHVMTPDEIAALLANTPDPDPEPVEAEPVVEEPVVEEEKPPMPDLSDPNHVMTPDEIAALLANM